MGRAVSCVVDQLCGPTDHAGAFDVLWPIVEKEPTISDVAGPALDVMVDLRVGFFLSRNVTVEAMLYTCESQEFRLVRRASKETCSVGILRVPEYRNIDIDGL